LRAEFIAPGLTIEGHLEDRITAQSVGVVAVLVAGGDHQQPEADNFGQAMIDPPGHPRVLKASGQALGDAKLLLDLAHGQDAAVRGQLTAVEPGDDRLSGDR
jgi:hypothetical protein